MILYISNIGYVFCHVLALSGFLLLRRDRPDWPRPIKMGRAWVPIAGVLALFNLILVLDGVIDQKVASYIGFYEFRGLPLFLGIGVLVAAVLLYFYRRAVQDKAKITFRDQDVPTMPNEEQMELLREEVDPGLGAASGHERRRRGHRAALRRSTTGACVACRRARRPTMRSTASAPRVEVR